MKNFSNTMYRKFSKGGYNMRKIKRIILLLSSIFIFYHTSSLQAMTYEQYMYGDMAYGSGNSGSGSSSGGGSGGYQGGGPSGPSGGYNGYPEIYQQQKTEEERKEKEKADLKAKEDAERIIAEAEAELAEEKRQQEEEARLEEERKAELARQEEERKAEEKRIEEARKAAEEKQKAEAAAKRKTELQNKIAELTTELQSIKHNNNKSSDPQIISKKLEQMKKELASIENKSKESKTENITQSHEETLTVNSELAGDPVQATTGTYIQTQTDIYAGWFEITRRYESDRTTVSSIGLGWTTNLDERIILGTEPMAQEIYSKMLDNIESLQNKILEYKNIICSDFAVTSVDQAREQIQQKIEGTNTIMQRAASIEPEFNLSGDEVYEQAQYKEDELEGDLLLLEIYLQELTSAQAELKACQEEAQNYKTKVVDKCIEKKTLNSRVIFSGDDAAKYETGHSTLTVIDTQGYPHLLYETSDNSGVWKNSKDKTIAECRTQENGYLLYMPDGRQKSFNRYGQLTKILDRNERYVLINRTDKGQIANVQTSEGEKLLFEYSGKFIKSITNARVTSHKVLYSYSQNQLSSFTDTDGDSIQFNYNSEGRLSLLTKCDGSQIQFIYGEKSYDGRTLTTKTINEEGFAETFIYDLTNKKTIYKNHDGNSTVYYYDQNHRTIRQENADGTIIQNKYDDDGNLIEKQKDGVRTVYAYDNNGNLLKASYSDGTSEQYAYDTFNLITWYKARNDLEYDFQRDQKGNVTRASCNGKAFCDITYDNKGNMAQSIVYEEPQIITNYEYDSFGNVIKQTQGKLITQFEYDSLNRVTKEFQNNKPIIWYKYEKSKTIQSSYNGLETTIIKNGRKDISDFIQKDTVTGKIIRTKLEYDRRHFPLRIFKGDADVLLLTDSYSYTPEGLIKEHILHGNSGEKNIHTSYEYTGGVISAVKKFFEGEENSAVNMKLEEEAVEQTKDIVETELSQNKRRWFEYDCFNRITAQIIGKTANIASSEYYITYDYSDDGRRKTITEGGLYTHEYEYDAFGNLIGYTDGNGNKTQYEYDYKKNLTCKTDPYGNKTSYSYNSLKLLKQITLPDSEKIIYEYDCTGNLLKVKDSQGTVYSAEYDTNGRLVKQQERAYPQEVYEYDDKNRITKYYCGNELVQAYQYNSSGTEITVKDGNGNDYHYFFNSDGQVQKEQNRLGDIQTYSYNSSGNTNQITEFDGSRTVFNTSENKLKKTISYEDNSQNTYLYNFLGNITHAQNKYDSTKYEYDKGGRLCTQNNITTGEKVLFEYDAAGNISRVSSSNKDTRYHYGKNNEILSIEDSKLDISIQLKYDSNGRETSRTFGNGTSVQTIYDKAGRTTLKIQKDNFGNLIWAQGYIYDSDGRISSTVDNTAHVTMYEYDTQGRVSCVYYPFTQEHEEQLKILYGENGLDTNESLSSNYFLSTAQKAALGQLLNQMQYTLAHLLLTNQIFIKENYAYDKNGNLIRRTNALGSIDYTYDKENHLLSSGSNGKAYVNYSYDKRGNLILQESSGQKTEYEYNHENRMTACKVIDKKAKSQSISKYAYDPFGRRIIVQDFDKTALRTIYESFTFGIIKEGQTFANGMFTTFGDSGFSSEHSLSPTGDRYRYLENDMDTNRYSYIDDNSYKSVSHRYKGERSSILVNGTTAAQATSLYGTAYFATDTQGSIRSITGQYKTAKIRFNYDIFGRPLYDDSSNTPATGLGYTGKQLDPTSKLYNYGFRDYSPSFARFTTRDPIRDGHNWFAYCNGDPVNFLDIDGLFSYKNGEQVTSEKTYNTIVYIFRDNDGLGNDFNAIRYIVKKDAAGNTKEYVDIVGANCKQEYYHDEKHNGFTTPDGKYYLTTRKDFTTNEDGTFDSSTFKNILALATKDMNISEEDRAEINNKLDRYFHANQKLNGDKIYNTPGSAGCIISKGGQDHHDEMMDFLTDGVDRPESIIVIIDSQSNHEGCSK